MDVPYVTVNWTKDIETPFNRDDRHAPEKAIATIVELKAPCYQFVNPADVEVLLDEPDRKFETPLKCIIIGTDKYTYDGEDLSCYVLVIVAIEGVHIPNLYRRVGVAKLRRSQVSPDTLSLVVAIQ
jgi:hypothetical protein